jgi:hypothetical protein
VIEVNQLDWQIARQFAKTSFVALARTLSGEAEQAWRRGLVRHGALARHPFRHLCDALMIHRGLPISPAV